MGADGRPAANRRRAVPVLDRIRRRTLVDHDSGCWLWMGALNADGYGSIGTEGTATGLVHRVAFELLETAIPEGLTLDHLCRVRNCWNPAHLEVVTRRVNILRGDTFQARNAKKTHCKWGHEFTTENTSVDSKGRRVCLACRSRRNQRRGVRCHIRC